MSKKFLLLFLVFAWSACQENVSTNIKSEQYHETLQNLVREAINLSYESIPGIAMAVIQEEESMNWVGAEGFDSVKKEDSVKADQPFRIASITKTFVATAILRLHEMDSISVEDPINDYISEEHLRMLRDEGYEPNKILIKHCLNHTAGLFDYAVGSSTYTEVAIKDPNRRWTRTEQLAGAMEWGSKIGEPGEKYFYSDTGYILLGEIIEKFSDGSLAAGLRSLLNFSALGLRDTWLETLEDHPRMNEKPVSRYFRGTDATEWDPSVDLYGGGGLVSTATDLATFIHALFNDQVFEHESTLDLMLTKSTSQVGYKKEDNRRYKDYRLGLWHHTVFGMDAYMHNGLWGSQMIHVPALNLSIGLNFTKGGSERLPKKTILLAKNLKET